MNKYLVAICSILMLAGMAGFALAQNASDDLGTQCGVIAASTTGCPNLNAADCKVLLQKCADYYDQQSALISQNLTTTSQQKSTLQSAISKLKSKINGLEDDISQGKIMVKDLNIQISDTQSSIDKTTSDIQDSQTQIAAILRSINQEDSTPSFVILLQGNLADFFSDVAYLETLNGKVSDLLDTTKNLKTYLQQQQIAMGNNVDSLQKTIAIQTLQEQQNQQAKAQQDQYLQLTEAQYEQQLASQQDIQAKSAKIKALLFQVAGVSQAPTFGQAIAIAQEVSQLVPIRPAFLLAILSQESALGQNVGSCLLTNVTTGEGKRISTGAYMPRVFKVSRDLQPFLQITASVGRDPLKSPISCDTFGSMGPAQFLPSTWMLFVDRLKALLGQTADPWAIKDSFTASALYLSDLGAGAQTATAEANAAYHYNGSGNAARIYSRTVMERATCIQTFIDAGTMSSDCQNLIF